MRRPDHRRAVRVLPPRRPGRWPPARHTRLALRPCGTARARCGGGDPMTPILGEGEMVLLLDSKARRYLVTLTSGKEFHSHSGYIAHDEIIGADEGATLRSTRGATYTVLRPTLSDFVL